MTEQFNLLKQFKAPEKPKVVKSKAKAKAKTSKKRISKESTSSKGTKSKRRKARRHKTTASTTGAKLMQKKQTTSQCMCDCAYYNNGNKMAVCSRCSRGSFVRDYYTPMV